MAPSPSLLSFSLSGGSIESGEPSTSTSVSMNTVSSCGLSLKQIFSQMIISEIITFPSSSLVMVLSGSAYLTVTGDDFRGDEC